jgi:tryptophan-rich sensory protein
MPSRWYFDLAKPSWTPEPGTIGLIWTILYPIIIVSFFFVLWKVTRGEMDRTILWVFLINIVANIIFTPIQFGLENLPLAALDILIVLGSIAAIIWLAWSKFPWLALAMVPYLIWVSIATALQLSITWMNR